MGYTGQSFIINCDQGGLNGNRNKSLIDPNDMIDGTRNLNIHEGARRKRGGTTRVTSEIDSGAQIYGIFDYLKPAGSQYIVFATSGKIWKNTTTTIKTGWTASKRVWFNQFGGEVYGFNGSDYPGKWNGTTWTDLSSDVPTDWGTSKPKYGITHGRGASERHWAFGCGSTPYTIYISPNDDGDDWSDVNVTTIKIDTKDGYGLTGGIVYLDQLIMFGRKQSYIVDDSDSNTTNWGYVQAPWVGGVSHQWMLIPTPNDVVCIDDNMEIYSIVAAQQYGDYEMASIARPSFIHNWIQDNVRMAYIANFHGIYDPILRAVRIFIVRNGQTTIDTDLVYFIDRGPKAGWMVHDNQSSASGHSASSSALIYVGAGDYEIYTGDYSGFIWKLEQSTKHDNSVAYSSGFKTTDMDFGNPRLEKHYRRGRIICDPQGTETLNVKIWIDGSRLDTPTGAWALSQAYTTVHKVTNDGKIYDCILAHTSAAGNEPGTGASWETYWVQNRFSFTVASGTKDYEFDIGARGKRIQLEVYNEIAGEDFIIEEALIDYKVLGAEAE
jgi:hypothetical protein